MSTVCDLSIHAQPAPQPTRLQQGRRAALGLLLLVEILVFTTRFDTATIADVSGPWAAVLGEAFLFGRFAISIVAALVIFGGRGLSRLWSQTAERVAGEQVSWPSMIFHAAAIVSFYALTAVVLEGELSSSAEAVWLAAWAVAGPAAIASWGAALMPLPFWRELAFRSRGVLLLGAACAATAVVAGLLADRLWDLLSGPTLRFVQALLGLIYDDVTVHGQVVGARSFQININAACSGFEGVGLIGVFVGAFLWSFRERLRFPQALTLLPLGMIAIWLANILRIAALVVIGASFSEQIATGGFHSQAGWIAFNAVALGLTALAWNIPALRTAAPERSDAAARIEYAAGPYLLPLLTLLAVTMLTTALSTGGGFDWLYPVRVVATLAVLGWFWTKYKSLGLMDWTWSWTPLAIGLGVFALWTALEPWSGVGPSASADQAAALAAASPLVAGGWILCRAIGSIVTVPIAEELAFRGYLTRQLVDEEFESVPLGQLTWFSLFVSSILFGLLHGRWLAGSLAGALFAVALWRRGKLSDAVVAHATANGLVTCYVLASGDFAAWS